MSMSVPSTHPVSASSAPPVSSSSTSVPPASTSQQLCLVCHHPILCTVGHYEIKVKYTKLFRQLFPKKPISLTYCTQCYTNMVVELETELKSQKEYQKSYINQLEELKAQTHQDYSITGASSGDGGAHSKADTKVMRYYVIDPKGEEFKRIEEHFHRTVKNKIIRIEKTNNPVLEQKFIERSKQLTCQKIQYLFHGSDNKAYDAILETGFDLSYAKTSGALGAGIYFAEDASYSHGYGRITPTTLGKINHILYCKVNMGRVCEGRTGLTEAPKGFDGVSGGANTYAFYHNFQGIPEYIIYYLVEDKPNFVDRLF